MARGLTISWACSRYRVGRDDGYRMRITVEACDMTDKVFAYRTLPKNPYTGTLWGHYDHVCSPVDLEEFPETEPDPDDQEGWFRLNVADVLVRSRAEADDWLSLVRTDLRRLVTTLNLTDTLIPTGSETIGAACPTADDSSSDSSTASESSESLGPLLSLTATGTLARQIGTGVTWADTGAGAGSPIVSSAGDGAFSSITLEGGQVSKGLLVQGFDFTDLPGTARIAGIEIALWVRSPAATSSISSTAAEGCDPLDPAIPPGPRCPLLLYVAVHQPSLGAAQNRAAGDCITDDNFQEHLFGGEDDLWGLTWTAAAIKDGAFGVLLVLGTVLTSLPIAAAVDGAQITVHYYHG